MGTAQLDNCGVIYPPQTCRANQYAHFDHKAKAERMAATSSSIRAYAHSQFAHKYHIACHLKRPIKKHLDLNAERNDFFPSLMSELSVTTIGQLIAGFPFEAYQYMKPFRPSKQTSKAMHH
jgi:hypothetical protein